MHLGGRNFTCTESQVIKDQWSKSPIPGQTAISGERIADYPLTSWKLDIRLEDILPVDLKRPKPVCVGGQRAGPPEDGLGAWQYLERLDNHKYSFPYEEFALMARAVQQVLESGTREGLNLDELREAMCRVEDYQQFRPDHFDRREVNRQLQSSAEEGERV